MKFALAPDQEELVALVRTVVERRAQDRPDPHHEVPHASDALLWEQLRDQVGVAALAVPEKFGGIGATSVETHLVLEVLGAEVLGAEVLSQCVLAVQTLLGVLGDGDATPEAHDEAEQLLAGLLDGGQVAVAWAGLTGDGSAGTGGEGAAETGALTATRSSDGAWSVRGAVAPVLGPIGDTVLVIAQVDGAPAVLAVTSMTGLTSSPMALVDQSVEAHRVTFDAAPARLLSSSPDVVRRLRLHATSAVTALQVGGAEAALRRTVEHLGEREQFGRPLGSFQALKHRVADLLVLVEAARSASWAAAWAVAHDAPDAERQAHVAKAWCSETFDKVTGESIQLHGGIAITWEHRAHRYFKRAHLTEVLLGDAAAHRRALLQPVRRDLPCDVLTTDGPGTIR